VVILTGSELRRWSSATVDHPLGCRRLERHVAPFRPMYALRRQERNDPTAGMGWIAGTGASMARQELVDCASMGLPARSFVLSMYVPNLP